MQNIFSIKNIIIFLIIINIISFLAMWIDKYKAKKGKWRIPEKTLIILSLVGGSIGSLCGMYTFRHKTKKMRFSIGIPAILIFQILLIVVYYVF